MSEAIKNGKKPLSSKKQGFLREEDVFGSNLSIPQHIKEDLHKRGLEPRYVDAKKLYENQGYHAKGWVPYKPLTQPSDNIKASEFKTGSDPDGVFRRGSLILAVKSVEECEKHRLLLRQKADRQKGYNKRKAAELQQFARESFGEAKKVVHEGYDENGDDAE